MNVIDVVAAVLVVVGALNYSWAVVGDPGRDYLWILARAPHLDGDSLAAARAVHGTTDSRSTASC